MFLSALLAVQTGATHVVSLGHRASPHLSYLADDVTMTPSGSGIPGGTLLQQAINWLGQYGLWACLGAVLIGGAIYGISTYAGNGYQGSKGRTVALAGAAGAVIIGLGPSFVNLLFHAANGAPAPAPPAHAGAPQSPPGP
jgi:hypothetical protein